MNQLQHLRAEYERLVVAVQSVKRDSAEHRALMAQKLEAFKRWHEADQLAANGIAIEPPALTPEPVAAVTPERITDDPSSPDANVAPADDGSDAPAPFVTRRQRNRNRHRNDSV